MTRTGIEKAPTNKQLSGACKKIPVRRGLLSAAEQLQKEHEHVDEVEVQVQCAHDSGFAQPFLVTARCVLQVGRFDLLCVIGCEACKEQHADGGDREHDCR